MLVDNHPVIIPPEKHHGGSEVRPGGTPLEAVVVDKQAAGLQVERRDCNLGSGQIYSEVVDLVVEIGDVGVGYLLVHDRLGIILPFEGCRVVKFRKQIRLRQDASSLAAQSLSF